MHLFFLFVWVVVGFMSVLGGTQCWKKVTVWEVIRGKGLALLADSDVTGFGTREQKPK